MQKATSNYPEQMLFKVTVNSSRNRHEAKKTLHNYPFDQL